jgi:hypothetical protein
MGLHFYLNNEDFDKNIDQYYESTYLKNIVVLLNESLSQENNLSVYFYLTVDFNKFNIAPNINDNNKKLCIIIDEYYKENPSLLEKFNYVFHSYLDKIESLNNYYHFPLGYSRNLVNVDCKVILSSQRKWNVFFSGNLHSGRKSFYKQISWLGILPFFASHRIQRFLGLKYDKLWPMSHIRFTNGFGKGLNSNDYTHFLYNTKIVLCPEGISNVESFRLYESLKAGCLVIAPKLPFKPFLEGIPIYQAEDWSNLHSIIKPLLEMQATELDNKQREEIDWWEKHLSERAVANYIIKLSELN